MIRNKSVLRIDCAMALEQMQGAYMIQMSHAETMALCILLDNEDLRELIRSVGLIMPRGETGLHFHKFCFGRSEAGTRFITIEFDQKIIPGHPWPATVHKLSILGITLGYKAAVDNDPDLVSSVTLAKRQA